jgi:hypothetical protein
METETVKTLSIKLTLTGEEANWLKGYLQNAFSDNESAQDTNMRHLFFITIREAFEK